MIQAATQINRPVLRFSDFKDSWAMSTVSKSCVIIDCEHKTAPYVEQSEFLVVRTSNVLDGHLLYKGMKYTTQEGYRQWTKRGNPSVDDVLFTREAPAGESCMVPTNHKVCLGQRMVMLRPSKETIIPAYLSHYLVSPKCKKNISVFIIGSTVSRINIADIGKIVINQPTKEEQQRIANFLTSVDTKIQQLKRKHTLMQQYKKGVMQQLFSQEIRFREDNGLNYPEWKKKPLKSIAVKSTTKNTDNKESFVLTNSATKGIISQQDYFDKDIANQNNLDGYYVVDLDDFVYNPRISSAAPVGPIKRNILKKGVMSPLYSVFRFTEKPLAYFEHYFETTFWHKYMCSVANYGARHDRMNITNSDFLNMPLPLPCEAERDKITDFLNSLDEKIDQLNIRITQAEAFKKGLLQQMFV